MEKWLEQIKEIGAIIKKINEENDEVNVNASLNLIASEDKIRYFFEELDEQVRTGEATPPQEVKESLLWDDRLSEYYINPIHDIRLDKPKSKKEIYKL